MAGPIDAITAFHNAFRRDMAIIDEAALALARGKQEMAETVERFRFFNEVLVGHATGEEVAIFPALEEVAPSVAEAYVRDHRGLDSAYAAMDKAISAGDTLETARSAAAFKFHLDMHLAKEDAHLYRLFGERVSLADQGKAVRVMASIGPQERFPEMIAWMFPLLEYDDRENLVRVWQMLMPPEVFAGAEQLIQRAVGADWAVLAQSIAGLSS